MVHHEIMFIAGMLIAVLLVIFNHADGSDTDPPLLLLQFNCAKVGTGAI